MPGAKACRPWGWRGAGRRSSSHHPAGRPGRAAPGLRHHTSGRANALSLPCPACKGKKKIQISASRPCSKQLLLPVLSSPLGI